jgi:hypothetical protein
VAELVSRRRDVQFEACGYCGRSPNGTEQQYWNGEPGYRSRVSHYSGPQGCGRSVPRLQNFGPPAGPEQRAYKSQSGVRAANNGHSKSCGRCGLIHSPKQCPAWGQRCDFCGGLHHYEAVCWGARRFAAMSRRFAAKMGTGKELTDHPQKATANEAGIE